MIPNLPNPHDKLTKEELGTFQRYLVIPNALSNEQCDELVAYGEVHRTPADNKHNHSQFKIVLDHCFLPLDHPIHTHLQSYWQQAIDYFGFEVEFIEPYELKKYYQDGFFSRHIDNYHGLNLPVDRKISMSVQLTDESEYTGGDLVMNFRPLTKKKGTIIFFPSFYPHNVEKVITGTRWSMISWAWGPYWK